MSPSKRMRKPRSKNNDLTGQRFEKWVVLRRSFHARGHGSMWECRCDCGEVRIVSLSNLRSGFSKSCGCLGRELARIRATKHGGRASPTYTVWSNMRLRCNWPKARGYANYGGRGIRVCSRWNASDGYAAFVGDMGVRPGPQYSIDRIDVNGNYEPGNCRWVHRNRQQHNTRKSTRITHAGATKTISEWARNFGISPGALHYRITVKKMPFLEAVSKPLAKRRVYVVYRKRRLTLRRLEGLTGVPHRILYGRLIRRNWPMKRALERPVILMKTGS